MIFSKWSETSVYILGFWFADGSIYIDEVKPKYYRKCFSLSNTDRRLMDVMAAALATPVFNKKTAKPHHKPCFKIRIRSDELFDFCYGLTGTTHKTNGVRMPAIPAKFTHHFIRGFFDGDGSIHYASFKNRHGKKATLLRSSFTASMENAGFLEDIKISIRKATPVGNRKIVSTKTGSKLCFGQYDTALLCGWMYSNAHIFMKRKKKMWDDSDKNRLLNSKKFFSNKV